MCSDAFEFPYCRLVRLVVFDMVEDLIICNDFLRLIIVDTAKELDPGRIIVYITIMVFYCSYNTRSKTLPILLRVIINVLPTRSLG
jgi:hypothetical protein